MMATNMLPKVLQPLTFTSIKLFKLYKIFNLFTSIKLFKLYTVYFKELDTVVRKWVEFDIGLDETSN